MNVIPDNIDFDAYLQEPDESAKVRPASDWRQEVIQHFDMPPEARGCALPWSKTNRVFRLRPHEVTLWAGFNGHGKTAVLSQVVKSLMAQGELVCIASMEMRPEATMARMVRQATGDACPSRDAIDAFLSWSVDRCWLYDQQGMVSPDRLIAVMRYAHRELGVTHFVIDSLLKCSLAEDDYNGQKAFVDQLCAHARDTGQHVHLVTHSRKLKNEADPPGKYDVRGSGSITDQVDNVIVVWRNKPKEEAIAKNKATLEIAEGPDCLLIVEKQRHFEWEGRVGLWYDRGAMTYLQHPDDRPQALNVADARHPDDLVEF